MAKHQVTGDTIARRLLKFYPDKMIPHGGIKAVADSLRVKPARVQRVAISLRFSTVRTDRSGS